jgi:hypothetical protein
VKIPGTVDLVLYGLLALALSGVVAVVMKWKHDAGLLPVERAAHKADVKNLNDTIVARDERIAIEIENRRFADESSKDYQARIRELEDQRTADSFGAIRVCRRPVIHLSAAAAGPAAGGPDAAAVPADPGAAEVSVDVGPAADLYGTRCEANTIQVRALERWILEHPIHAPARR